MSAGTYSDWMRALGQNESGNNYGFVSSLGYLGRFQFGEEALKAIGFYQGDSTWAIDFQGGWTETAHTYGVWDKASFLASSAAQDAAGEAWFRKIHDDAASVDILKYEGQVVAGIPITMSGILAGAHLTGVWNLKSFLESGGAIDIRDGYGTPTSEYVQRFGGFDTPFSTTTTTGSTPSGGVGGGPNDVLQGGDGADSLYGGDGDDTVAGGAGMNLLRGDAGNDLLKGGWQFDDLHGGTGDDTAYGGMGDDWVVGGQGNDVLFGEDGGDIVLGNMGLDTVDGGAGDDVVRGGQGDDIVRGGAGDDFVSGDRGDDVLVGGDGADTFHTFVGAGLDTVLDFHYAEGDRVRLLAGTSYTLTQAGADTIIDLGNGDHMVLAGVTYSSLPSDWIM